MKIFLTKTLLTFLSLVFISCGAREKIRISGSETMMTMMEIAGFDYRETQSDHLVEVHGGGSSVGMLELLQNKSHAAMTSREPTVKELENLDRISKWEKQILAYDGVAIIVNDNSQLTRLNLSQLRDVFSGKITNFRQLGGKDLEILPIIRNEKSGTLKFFREFVFNTHHSPEDNSKLGIDFGTNVRIVATNEELLETVKTKEGAISFIGMGLTHTDGSGIKTLKFSLNDASEFIEPTPKNVYDRKYSLSRALYLVYFTENSMVSDFVAYLLSERGQNRIQAAGYLRATVPEIEVKDKKE